ncbi:MAG TPA: hypothetical protein VK191_04165 [Symbiobacteriaceae bacterium]|nr:hypothetical protein [Symbiobacteriaceae bacterium]
MERPTLTPEERDILEAQLAAEAKLKAAVHRQLGMIATLLVFVAIGVALWRMQTMFGVSAWYALSLGSGAFSWVLLILGVGAVFGFSFSWIGLVADWNAARRLRKQQR